MMSKKLLSLIILAIGASVSAASTPVVCEYLKCKSSISTVPESKASGPISHQHSLSTSVQSESTTFDFPGGPGIPQFTGGIFDETKTHSTLITVTKLNNDTGPISSTHRIDTSITCSADFSSTPAHYPPGTIHPHHSSSSLADFPSNTIGSVILGIGPVVSFPQSPLSSCTTSVDHSRPTPIAPAPQSTTSVENTPLTPIAPLPSSSTNTPSRLGIIPIYTHRPPTIQPPREDRVPTTVSVDPATTLEARQGCPMYDGCSACSECCLFKLGEGQCGEPVAVTMKFLADGKCQNTPYRIPYWAFTMTECTGAFETCYIFNTYDCADINQARTIQNRAGQCINFAPHFWILSIQCYVGGPEATR